jgi:Ser/Thr protein kinase RdoA (MazF antagonist)
MTDEPQQDSLDEATDLFVGLTPDFALDAIERAGLPCGTVCVSLNSFENRVYEIELRDAERSRMVAKFYRPHRWTEAQIREEHAFLRALSAADVPVCDVVDLPNGDTLAKAGHIWFALFALRRGRAPDEVTAPLAHRMGSLSARIHNVGATLPIAHRRTISADFLDDCLDELVDGELIPPHLRSRYEDAGREISATLDERLVGVDLQPIHGDMHAGNLITYGGILNVLDFDDMMIGPAIQDLWLLLPSRDEETKRLRRRFLQGYEQFRAFDATTLRLLEPLRGYRYINYALWLARRWHDPIFPLTWPQFGSATWWQSATSDLEDVLASCNEATLLSEAELLEDDGGAYFWDLED